MYDIKAFLNTLESVAPLSLSQKMIENGCHDNSGIIVKAHAGVERVLFALDLSTASVKRALANKCDTIVTHHPAIYYPISELSMDGDTSPLLQAVSNGVNVISMHLNLDIADRGIDHHLCLALGGESYRILFNVDESHGYGREFSVSGSLAQIVKNIKKDFSTRKVVVYGKPSAKITKIACFCGAGADDALKAVGNGLTDADLIVTSDMAHHQIKELVERGKNIVILPHYVAEEVGFKAFYQEITEKLNGEINTYYFDDKRFR